MTTQTNVITTPVGRALFVALDQPSSFKSPDGEEAGAPKYKIKLAFDVSDPNLQEFEAELADRGVSLKRKKDEKTGKMVATLTASSRDKPLVFGEEGLIDQLPQMFASVDKITASAKVTTYEARNGMSYLELEAVQIHEFVMGERKAASGVGGQKADVRQQILKAYMDKTANIKKGSNAR